MAPFCSAVLQGQKQCICGVFLSRFIGVYGHKLSKICACEGPVTLAFAAHYVQLGNTLAQSIWLTCLCIYVMLLQASIYSWALIVEHWGLWLAPRLLVLLSEQKIECRGEIKQTLETHRQHQQEVKRVKPWHLARDNAAIDIILTALLSEHPSVWVTLTESEHRALLTCVSHYTSQQCSPAACTIALSAAAPFSTIFSFSSSYSRCLHIGRKVLTGGSIATSKQELYFSKAWYWFVLSNTKSTLLFICAVECTCCEMYLLSLYIS